MCSTKSGKNKFIFGFFLKIGKGREIKVFDDFFGNFQIREEKLKLQRRKDKE